MILSSNKIVSLLVFGVEIVLFPARTLACCCASTETSFIEVAQQEKFI